MIRSEFNLDYTQSGLVVSAFNLSYGISQLPGGWLADRVGYRILITIGICGTALAGIIVGLSPTLLLIIFSLALMGLLGGGYHPAAPILISAAVEKRNQGRALGYHLIGGGSSSCLGPLIAMAIASFFNWRVSFISLGLVTLGFGIYFYAFLGRLEAADQAQQPNGPSAPMVSSVSPNVRLLAVFILLSTFTQAVTISAISFVPLYLVDHLGFSKGTAGAFFAWIYSSGMWVSPLAGYLSDRIGRVPIILAVCFVAGPVIYALNLVTSPWVMIILLIVIGIIMYVRMPITEAYILRQTSEQNRSLILGLYYFGSLEGGGLLTPLMGYLIDHLGFATSFTIAGASIAIVTLLCSTQLWGSRD
jgi:MFS family permease